MVYRQFISKGFFILFFLFIACKKDNSKTPTTTQDVKPQPVDSLAVRQSLPLKGLELIKNTKLNPQAQKIANQWQLFLDLDLKVSNINTVNRTRLISYVEETETLYLELKAGKFPAQFNSPRIKSRFLLFNTLLLKLKDHADDSRLSDSLLASETLEVVEALNNTKSMMNILATEDIESDDFIN